MTTVLPPRRAAQQSSSRSAEQRRELRARDRRRRSRSRGTRRAWRRTPPSRASGRSWPRSRRSGSTALSAAYASAAFVQSLAGLVDLGDRARARARRRDRASPPGRACVSADAIVPRLVLDGGELAIEERAFGRRGNRRQVAAPRVVAACRRRPPCARSRCSAARRGTSARPRGCAAASASGRRRAPPRTPPARRRYVPSASSASPLPASAGAYAALRCERLVEVRERGLPVLARQRRHTRARLPPDRSRRLLQDGVNWRSAAFVSPACRMAHAVRCCSHDRGTGQRRRARRDR